MQNRTKFSCAEFRGRAQGFADLRGVAGCVARKRKGAHVTGNCKKFCAVVKMSSDVRDLASTVVNLALLCALARSCSKFQGLARKCSDLRGVARRCAQLRGLTRIRANLRECVRACAGVLGLARGCARSCF